MADTRTENDAWITRIRKGVVELAVLALLGAEPKYGSQIVEELATQPALALTSGTVYPLLSRLRKAGLVDTAWQESPVGPPRKYYTLTADGTVALAEMTGAWRSVVTAVDATIAASHPKGTAS